MKSLQITEDQIQSFSANGIVVCSGKNGLNESVLYIDIQHQIGYPELPEVEIVTESDLAARVSELEAINAALIEVLNEKNIIP